MAFGGRITINLFSDYWIPRTSYLMMGARINGWVPGKNDNQDRKYYPKNNAHADPVILYFIAFLYLHVMNNEKKAESDVNT